VVDSSTNDILWLSWPLIEGKSDTHRLVTHRH